MRFDYGNTSVITDPVKGETVLLDHVKQEVRVIPPSPGLAPPQMKLPGIPGMPGAPTPPTMPPMSVKDLGTRMVQGVEVQGKQYTLPSLAPPAPPPLPGMPGAPAIPGMPAKPAMPGMPSAPAIPTPPQPTVVESWVSTKTQIPVLTRITGPFGQSMCHCKNTVPGEPPASAFQIPPNYKQIGLPAAPAPPPMPAMPAAPAPPPMPSMPKAPMPPSFKF